LKTVILSSGYSIPSCKILRDSLLEKTEVRYPIYKNVVRIKPRDKVLLRYGNIQPVPCIDTVFNPISFISLVGSKKRFSDFCLENEFLSPKFNFNGRPENYPVLIRTTLSGAGGKGIILIRNEAEFNNNFRQGYCWTPFIKTKKEFRFHVFDGTIYRIFEKVKEGEEEELPIRNNDRGYTFVRKNVEVFPKSQELVSRLNGLFNLPNNCLFYGLDVGVTLDGKLFIFEANSACGLNENTANDLADKILERLNRDG
jgi:glutathione synthase/RimK-type ligase-like ATP-grasp enzyme